MADMTGENGVLQAAGIVWCVIGIILFIWSVQNFAQKSKIVELLMDKEAGAGKEVRRIYRIAGYVLLYLALISFLVGAFCLLNQTIFLSMASVLALSGILIILIRVFTGYKN